jgi:G3E family GTPase
MKRIAVTIITGFLGSGKTTLLNSLLKHPDMSRAAIIVNEFGEVGLDYDLVETSNETVVQLANGCLCCTVKGDLIDTFRDLYLRRKGGQLPWFDRVVIETTGIADPIPVMQIVVTNPLISTAYELDGVVTTVDAVNAQSTLDAFPESVNQVAVADRVVLTKTDLVEGGADRDAKLGSIRARIRSLNPLARLIEGAPQRIDPAWLFGEGLTRRDPRDLIAEFHLDEQLAEEEHEEARAVSEEDRQRAADHYAEVGHRPSDESHHDPSIKTFCLVREEPVGIDTLRLYLEAMTRAAGPNLLRVKGLVNIAEKPGEPAVIQGAQNIFHSLQWLKTWPSEDMRTRIVFITRGIDKAYAEDSFALVERVAKRTAEAAAHARQGAG